MRRSRPSASGWGSMGRATGWGRNEQRAWPGRGDKLEGGMTRQRTGTSSSYGTTDPSFVGGGPDAASKPGLVLLYARNFEQFLPAYPFHKPAVIIGRDAEIDVCVPEQAVSRQHARIAFDGTRWILTDLGSRNGTMVDGAFVTQDVELEHLHEIRVGDALFKFVASGADRFAAYHIDGRVLGERRA